MLKPIMTVYLRYLFAELLVSHKKFRDLMQEKWTLN